MDWFIVLSCVGLTVAQTPTYLSLVSSSYQMSDPRLHRGRGSTDEVQLRGPADGLQNNSNQSLQNINAFIGTTRVDGNAQTDRQTVQQDLSIPQPRLFSSGRSQGAPSSLLIPGLSAFLPHNLVSQPNLGALTYNVDVVTTRNGQSHSLNANPRSNEQPRLNPHYVGPALFSHSAQAAAEQTSTSQQYQPSSSQSYGVDPSLSLRTLTSNFHTTNLINNQRSQNALPNSRSSFDQYYTSNYGSQHMSSQNEDNVQQITRGTLDPVNYQFSYDVNAVEKGRAVQFAHEEQRGHDQAAGAYTVLLPDGQRQVVEYTADEDGYRPRVSYDGRRTFEENQGINIYGDHEQSVIAARSQQNGRLQPSLDSHYQPLVQSRLQNRPY